MSNVRRQVSSGLKKVTSRLSKMGGYKSYLTMSLTCYVPHFLVTLLHILEFSEFCFSYLNIFPYKVLTHQNKLQSLISSPIIFESSSTCHTKSPFVDTKVHQNLIYSTKKSTLTKARWYVH